MISATQCIAQARAGRGCKEEGSQIGKRQVTTGVVKVVRIA